MSVEALVVAAIVDDGAPALRKLYQAGVSAEDFVSFEDEFQWVAEKLAAKQPMNVRTFRNKFPDFEWMVSSERLQDLLQELKQERAYYELRAFNDTLSSELEQDNAIEKIAESKEILSQIARLHVPVQNVALISGWRDHLADQRALRSLRDAGTPPGIPSGFKWLDHHWDGLGFGRMIVVLGRPGNSKSLVTTKFAATAALNKYRVLLFSPEMNRREHECRLNTILSADPNVKKVLGLKHAFRNRALMNGVGYNLKSYRRFLEYIESLGGEVVLINKTNNHQLMTPSFIEAQVADLNPDLVIIDPIYKLKAPRNRDSRVAEIADIADSLNELSRSYNIPVVATNQANRQGDHKGDAPHQDSSFNSDVPVQVADAVIGLKHVEDENRLIFRCSKSRFGQDFRFEAEFYPNIGMIREIDEPAGNYYNGKESSVEDEELREIVDSAVGTKGGENDE